MQRIRHIPAGNLHVSKPTWWLESRFHFSFADYFNLDNMNFGVLRVMNDDLVKAKAGFGTHPHRDAEIFSYVVDGELSHADNMGNKEALGRGSVQYLSAGTGITHSEMNEHPTKTCRFVQVWITPDARGHKPQYGSQTYDPKDRVDKLLHVIGGTGATPAWKAVHEPTSSIRLHQDCNVFVSELDSESVLDINVAKGRQAYLLCIEGALAVNDTNLAMRDAAEVVAGDQDMAVTLKSGQAGAHLMLIEMNAP